MYSEEKVRSSRSGRTLLRLAVAVMVGLGVSSVANATHASLPWESGLGVFMASITGPVAGIISVLAICVCGGLLAMGAELNDIVKRSAQVVLAIGICVGAATVIGAFTNNQATTTGAVISMAIH